MDAVEFIKQARRMGKAKGEAICFKLEETDTEIVERVEQWAKEHPVKTRQSELLKLFHNAKIDNAGTLCICPINFDPDTYKGENKCFCIHKCDDIQCDECRRDFWLKEIE